MKNLFNGAITILLAVFFIACENDELPPETSATDVVEAVNEYALVNSVFQDVGNNGGDALINARTAAENGNSKSVLVGNGETPEITIQPFDLNTFPKTTTVDFKDGILCVDGVTRQGKMQIISTNWYREINSVHITKFDNYYHNGYKVEGTHVVTNLGENADENLRYGVEIDDGKITLLSGETITYKENSYRTWVLGSDTPLYIWDDEYLLDGTQSGTTSKNLEYKLDVMESLHFTLLPRAIVSGILSVDIANFEDILIDYENRTITIFGTSYPF